MAGMDRLKRDIAKKIETTMNTTVRQTQDQPIDAAAAALRRRLSAAGVDLSLPACRDAVETMRRGDTYRIDLR